LCRKNQNFDVTAEDVEKYPAALATAVSWTANIWFSLIPPLWTSQMESTTNVIGAALKRAMVHLGIKKSSESTARSPGDFEKIIVGRFFNALIAQVFEQSPFLCVGV